MTVRELLSKIDAHELAEWRAFFMIERELMDAERKPKPQDLSEKIKASFRKAGHGC